MAIRYAGLAHIALRCNNYEKMFEFYVNKLGGRNVFHLNKDCLPEGRGDESLWLTYVCFGKNQFIELFSDGYEGDNAFGKRSHVHFCLEVGNQVEALKALDAEGITIYSSPEGSKMPKPYSEYPVGMCGTRCAFICDPEGNWIEIQQFTPNSMQILCI
jgi:catechol 2,3-dioxygenase-like lactoylglutathione lyase family enzyme